MKKIFTILCCLFIIHCTQYTVHCFAQDQHLVESLQTELQTARHDTIKVKILLSMARAYFNSDQEKAIYYARQATVLSEKTAYKKGIATSCNILGILLSGKDYSSSMEFYKKSLKINEEMGDKNGMAGNYSNMGGLYYNMQNYPEAIKNFLIALKINEEIGNIKGLGAAYGNIGLIYNLQGNQSEALKHYLAALKIFTKLGDKYNIAVTYNNLGGIYLDRGNFKLALQNYLASLKIHEELGNQRKISSTYRNIGSIYYHQRNFPEALKYYFSSLEMDEKAGDSAGIASCYNSIGAVYTIQKKYPEAFRMLNKALAISKESEDLELITGVYENIARLDSAQGIFSLALVHYKLYIAARDSLFNQEKNNDISRQLLQFDFDKKQAVVKAEQEMKDVLNIKELQRQKLVRNSFVGGFTIVLIFALIFFMQRIRISKEKKRSEELLLNILPAEVAEELKEKGYADAKQFDEVTVLFTDFKGFTAYSEKMTPHELVKNIDECFKEFDRITSKYGIEKIKTIGDSYMCAGGLPVEKKTNPEDTIMAALEMRDFVLAGKQKKIAEGKPFFEIRIGVHTGPVVAGIVGIKKFAYDIWGDTVNTASRMESSGEAGKVNISGSTYQLVKDMFSCTYRGKIAAKNKGMIDMYFVDDKASNI